MRRRSLQLNDEEIPNVCELRSSTDNAAANKCYNGHSRHGREEEVSAVVQRRQRRVTITATTPPLPPLQMTAMPATSRGGVCGFASPPHRPLAVRTILSTASAFLLLIVIGDICFFSANNSNKYTTDDINDLTQTVMRLSQELHDAQIDNERTHNELELVEKDLSDNKIELKRETHYVRSMEERNRLMKESMLDQIHKDQINIIDTTKAATEIAARQKQEHEVQLMKEHDENIQLRVELAKSIEELDRVRRIQKQQQQLKAPIGFEDEEEESRAQRDELSGSNSSNTKSYERLLRGGISNYQPGDSIEIIERIQHDDGVTKIALRPGIVADFNSDGTYNLVKLEQSNLIKNIKRERFRSYSVYTSGTSALYEHQPKNYTPITIVRYIESSAKPGLEVHGNYLFTYDAEDKEIKVLHEARAMLIYRYAEDGDIDL